MQVNRNSGPVVVVVVDDLFFIFFSPLHDMRLSMKYNLRMDGNDNSIEITLPTC